MRARDARGRFVNEREHDYVLRFDMGEPEYIRALSAHAAVRARLNVMLPSTITDLTVMREWAHGRIATHAPARVERLSEAQSSTWLERMAQQARERGRA